MPPRRGEKHQNLSIVVDASAPPLFADERALKQILINLVSNAVKFTPEGGRISVIGSAARGGGFQISVQGQRPRHPAREARPHLHAVQPGSTTATTGRRGGTGLGLALIRGLAELHGGRAWLESEPGKGCCAYVVLPLEGERAKTEMAAAAAVIAIFPERANGTSPFEARP